MNIFIIWESFPPCVGGAAARGYRLFKAMSEQGHNITVFTAKPPKTKFYEEYSSNLKVVRVPPVMIYPPKKSRFALIYNTAANTLRFFALFVLMLFFYLKKRPDVVLQEVPAWMFTSKILHLLKLESSLISPWVFFKKVLKIPLCVYFVGLWGVPECHFPRWLNFADGAVVVDKWIAGVLGKRGYEKKVSYVPVSVDLSRFEVCTERPEDTVLYVGRLQKDRGCDLLLKAAPKILKEVPDARFIIIGEGSERLHLEEMIKDYGIGEAVTLKGAVDSREVQKVYGGAKVMVNPLRAPGIGNVTIEALVSGVPVVKTKIEGYDNYPIKDGFNGYSFGYDNSEDLADKVILVLKSDNWEEMSRSAAETSKCFDMEKGIKGLEEALSSLTK